MAVVGTEDPFGAYRLGGKRPDILQRLVPAPRETSIRELADRVEAGLSPHLPNRGQTTITLKRILHTAVEKRLSDTRMLSMAASRYEPSQADPLSRYRQLGPGRQKRTVPAPLPWPNRIVTILSTGG